jgi:hypothetical protein
MAQRPVFVANLNGRRLVAPIELEFNWSAGLAPSQKQKNIRSLHSAAAQKRGLKNVLEISTKSENPLGVALSAFNLQLITSSGLQGSIENLFQASKVFERGGPFVDLLDLRAAQAKSDQRLKQSGALKGFRLEGMDWPLQPTTVFYDWLYLSALKHQPGLAEQLPAYDGFTDIEFNPARSLNCQAASAALYVSLLKRNELDTTLASSEAFLARLEAATTNTTKDDK